MAFAISGFLASVAGALIVYVSQGFDIGTFAPEQSLNTFISAVIGGVGSTLGGILGAVVYDGSRNWLSGPWALLPSAVGVLVVLLVLPGGLADLVYRVRDAAAAPGRRPSGHRRPEPGRRRPDRARRRGRAGRRDPRRSPACRAAPSITAPVEAGWLSVRGLDVAYGGAQVLFGVDVDIPQGEITALLGTNGAGKSTLLRAVGGIAPVTGGRIHLGGVDLVELRPDQIAAPRHRPDARRPGRVPVAHRRREPAGRRLAHPQGPRRGARRASPRCYERFPVLSNRRGDEAGNLSGGQQQQLALGMALLARPALLLVDELSLGLAPAIVDQLMDELRQLCDEGTTIVVVEQSVNVALTMANHAYFMEKGEVRFSGPAAGPARPARPRPVRVPARARRPASPPAAPRRRRRRPAVGGTSGHGSSADGDATVDGDGRRPALEVHGLSVSFGGIAAVNDVDLTVAPGEIVGLIGPNGAGKTTIFDLISGFTSADAGRVTLHGRDVTGASPADRARAGLGRSFQDARLFAGLTVEETIAVALERWIQAGDPLSAALPPPGQRAHRGGRRRTGRRADRAVRHRRVPRRSPSASCPPARDAWSTSPAPSATSPSVILLDEPSSGIAQREAEALVPLLLELRDRLGASLLVVEHDMALVTSVADRLVALDQGAVLTVGPPDEVLEHPEVVASYLGSNAVTRQRSGPSQTLVDARTAQGAPPA